MKNVACGKTKESDALAGRVIINYVNLELCYGLNNSIYTYIKKRFRKRRVLIVNMNVRPWSEQVMMG